MNQTPPLFFPDKFPYLIVAGEKAAPSYYLISDAASFDFALSDVYEYRRKVGYYTDEEVDGVEVSIENAGRTLALARFLTSRSRYEYEDIYFESFKRAENA